MRETAKVVKSVIAIPHTDNCEALKWVSDGMSPIEWNVLKLVAIEHCDENGKQMTIEELEEKGTGYLFYELCCGDKECPARKRVFAQEIARI
jgi:hypothetical protein